MAVPTIEVEVEQPSSLGQESVGRCPVRSLSLSLSDQAFMPAYKATENQCPLNIRLTQSAKTAHNKAESF